MSSVEELLQEVESLKQKLSAQRDERGRFTSTKRKASDEDDSRKQSRTEQSIPQSQGGSVQDIKKIFETLTDAQKVAVRAVFEDLKENAMASASENEKLRKQVESLSELEKNMGERAYKMFVGAVENMKQSNPNFNPEIIKTLLSESDEEAANFKEMATKYPSQFQNMTEVLVEASKSMAIAAAQQKNQSRPSGGAPTLSNGVIHDEGEAEGEADSGPQSLGKVSVDSRARSMFGGKYAGLLDSL